MSDEWLAVTHYSLLTEEKQHGEWTPLSALSLEADTTVLIWLPSVPFALLLCKQVFTNQDGSQGILVISCHQPVGSPSGIFEGITATKGFLEFNERVPPVPGVDANRNLFHVVP